MPHLLLGFNSSQRQPLVQDIRVYTSQHSYQDPISLLLKYGSLKKQLNPSNTWYTLWTVFRLAEHQTDLMHIAASTFKMLTIRNVELRVTMQDWRLSQLW